MVPFRSSRFVPLFAFFIMVPGSFFIVPFFPGSPISCSSLVGSFLFFFAFAVIFPAATSFLKKKLSSFWKLVAWLIAMHLLLITLLYVRTGLYHLMEVLMFHWGLIAFHNADGPAQFIYLPMMSSSDSDSISSDSDKTDDSAEPAARQQLDLNQPPVKETEAPAAPPNPLAPPHQVQPDESYLQDLLHDPSLGEEYRQSHAIQERITLRVHALYPEGQHSLQEVRQGVDVALTDIMAKDDLRERDLQLVDIFHRVGEKGRCSKFVAEVEAWLEDP